MRNQVLVSAAGESLSRREGASRRRIKRRDESGLISLMAGLKEGESEYIPLKSQTQQSPKTKTNIRIDVISTSSSRALFVCSSSKTLGPQLSFLPSAERPTSLVIPTSFQQTGTDDSHLLPSCPSCQPERAAVCGELLVWTRTSRTGCSMLFISSESPFTS